MYFRALMKDSWNFTFFIARTLQKQQVEGKKVARPITRIATISIALAMIVNIITLAVVNGFQQEVRRKVIGFGSHISIQKSGEGSLFESDPLKIDNQLIESLKATPGIQSVQPVAYKPALFQSVTTNEQREIMGVILKGVSSSYDWSFMKENLVEGRLPNYGDSLSEEILISRRICNDLHYKLGDTAKAYFVKQQPIMRQYVITGIYETGLEDFDKEMVFCHLPQVQKLNDWGIQATILIDDTLIDGQLIIRADVSGGNGHYRYDWGKGYERFGGFPICPVKDTIVRLIVADYWSNMNEPTGSTTFSLGETAIPDTAYLKISVTGNKQAYCNFKLDADKALIRNYKDELGYVYELDAGEKMLTVTSVPGKGNSENYIGSYELMVDDWNSLDILKHKVAKTVTFRPEMQQQVQVKSIKDLQNELFVWLGFLDVNMAIILILMLIIGIINMGSALLVMILVRTNFIGIMKAMGATNWTIRKIFIIQAGQLILKGMFWGNLIGIGFCLVQHYFGVLSLDPKVYYLTKVPVSINAATIIGLNVITLGICLFALLLPSVVITRVSPSKSIRFR